MASVTSLGIHRPSAVPYLVAEGVLPTDPSPELYDWHTIPNDALSSDYGAEELLTTEYCVVWSRGGVVERLFRFDLEKEPVKYALFSHFDSAGTFKRDASKPEFKFVEPDGVKGLNGHRLDDHSPRVLGSDADTTKGIENGPVHNKKELLVQQPGKISHRALVIIFKTQAQIFFLSGTSHIVHLPFEVDRVLPLPRGLLLQRKLPQASAPSTPTIPSVPQNSFAFETLASSEAARSSQAHPTLNDLRETADPNVPFLPMLKNFLQQASNTATDEGLPRLYCLTDPLTEIGVVVTGDRQPSTWNVRKHTIQTFGVFDTIEPTENILYVSQSDDLEQPNAESDGLPPIFLVVTQNQESLEYTIWSAQYVEDRFLASKPHSLPPQGSCRNNRRRSSYGIGTSTGANTPAARGTTVGRESYGLTRSRRSAARDLLSEDSFNDGEDNLVSHLDSALVNPSALIRSSRRVSSLLARADFSSTQDKTTFSDLAGGYPASLTTRKGTSFGSHGLRLSSGADTGSNFLRAQRSGGLRTSIEPPAVIESYERDLEDNDDEPGAASDSSKDSSLRHQFRGLRKEIVLRRIHIVGSEKVNSPTTSPVLSGSTRPRIFVLKPPAHIVGANAEEADAFLCIADRSAGSLLVVSLRRTSSSRVHRGNKRNAEAPISHTSSQRREIQITGTTRSSRVIDTCKIRDKHCHRLLILSHGPNGSRELTLQDPWGPQCVIWLPSKLFLYDPFRIVNILSPRQRREGGFKRILNQGPQALMSLSHGGNRETVDLLDTGGSRHRVEVQLQPRNPFVRTMIRLCDSMLSPTGNNGEVILNGWWNAMAWLSAQPDIEADFEWTAFVVVLFSIAAGFVEDRRAEATTRQKKRKSGLLRSSSGANTNMESWEAMLVEESSSSRSVPAWMEGEAWAWTPKQAKVPDPAEPGVPRKPRSSRSSIIPTLPSQKKSLYLIRCMSLAREFRSSSSNSGNIRGSLPVNTRFNDSNSQRRALATLLVGLHLLREEYKLNILASSAAHDLTPVLAQIGGWLEWPSWGCNASAHYMLENVDMESWLFDDWPVRSTGVADPAEPFQPPSVMRFVEAATIQPPSISFISLSDVVGYQHTDDNTDARRELWAKELLRFTPRTLAINGLLTPKLGQSMEARVADMTSWGWSLSILETLPESIAVTFRSAISICQPQASAVSDKATLDIIGRDDISIQKEEAHGNKPQASSTITPQSESIRDVHSICNSTLDVDTVGAYEGTAETDRQSTSRMVFKDDQRFVEAAKLLHPLHAPMAQCVPEPEWSDTDLLEAQQELAKTIAMRTLAVSPGRSCLFYSARLPLLTEKFPIHGFTLSCIMMPSNTTITADKAAYTEEKVSWAFFHAGVEAGLSIAKGAKGIDTSWILFNKPQELKNRHAGFLLALGLNGHLKSIAKWVAFKYLTPKHTMTSIGLLLGLAASYLGTMDTLITRLLSVHVTRMLPPGAAELNLSPLTQTSGIMGIGLLYCETQHRRMSEIMLSEMENEGEDEDSSPQDDLRDEGYRLAAGFALGFINLGRGKDLKGLHDMHLVERLLALAIGTKKVTIVHILDRATAAATVAVALIFMKTHHEALARKIDIPDTIHQFEYVRPDIFLLRTVARHLIMWNDIHATSDWIKAQLPMVYQYKAKLTVMRTLNSDEMPFLNIIAGLCLAIGLRNAGTGSAEVRNLLCHYLDQFTRICKLPVLNYDGKLTRITVRNCQDAVALAAACVMAGTGDLHVFRRLRSLHGRVEVDIPYGSHLAAHLAIGILFLGGGTYSFGTSDLAVASLLCAFYPLFPATVLDNKSHLQAFRHFWVLAAEPRCLTTYDIDTRRLISLPVVVTLQSGQKLPMTAPCLLPEFDTVAKIQTNDPEYWSVTLDLGGNTSDHQAFRQHQGIWVRRRAAYDTHLSLFSATMHALDDAQSAHMLSMHIFEWVFRLKTFHDFDRAEQALVLPPDLTSVAYRSTRGTVVDDRLVLETGCMTSGKSERLWNLRILFAWADTLSKSRGKWGWIGKEVVERLKTRLTKRKTLH